MKKIIIMCHGNLATEFLKTTEMIMGPQQNLVAINFTPEMDPDNLEKNLKTVVSKSVPIILTDLKGGTPFNIGFKYKYENECELFSGVNLPLIIELVNQVILLNNEDITEVKNKTNEYIEYI